jgi:hypothetical protein
MTVFVLVSKHPTDHEPICVVSDKKYAIVEQAIDYVRLAEKTCNKNASREYGTGRSLYHSEITEIDKPWYLDIYERVVL